jgi:hypothetical protein
MSFDLERKHVTLAIRFPDETGKWARKWREQTMILALPEPILTRLKQGEALAPTLREIIEADGTRYAVLDFMRIGEASLVFSHGRHATLVRITDDSFRYCPKQ